MLAHLGLRAVELSDRSSMTRPSGNSTAPTGARTGSHRRAGVPAGGAGAAKRAEQHRGPRRQLRGRRRRPARGRDPVHRHGAEAGAGATAARCSTSSPCCSRTACFICSATTTEPTPRSGKLTARTRELGGGRRPPAGSARGSRSPAGGRRGMKADDACYEGAATSRTGGRMAGTSKLHRGAACMAPSRACSSGSAVAWNQASFVMLTSRPGASDVARRRRRRAGCPFVAVEDGEARRGGARAWRGQVERAAARRRR